MMFSKCQFHVKKSVLIFWGNPQGVPVNSEYSQELCQMIMISAFASICHTSSLPKFGHQTLNCPSMRYIVPAKIFPALLCQKNWFCGKVRLDYFYRLLRSIASTWIHIGVKRISQACCLNNQKNIEKIVKHNFEMKNKIRPFFWATLYVSNLEFVTVTLWPFLTFLCCSRDFLYLKFSVNLFEQIFLILY